MLLKFVIAVVVFVVSIVAISELSADESASEPVSTQEIDYREYQRAAQRAASYYGLAGFYAQLAISFPNQDFDERIILYDGLADFFAAQTDVVGQTPFRDMYIPCEGCDPVFFP